MILSRVTGSVHATVKDAALAAERILLTQAVDLDGVPFGRPLLALIITAVLCISCLFLVGAARSFFTGKNATRSGFEMTLVGSVVAVISVTPPGE